MSDASLEQQTPIIGRQAYYLSINHNRQLTHTTERKELTLTTPQRTRPPRQRLTPVSVENVRRILSTCHEDPKKQDLGDVVRVLANTGLRLGELRDLTWTRVDFANSRIVVDSSRTMSYRYVPIGPKTILALKARQDRQPASDFVFGEARHGIFNRALRQLHIVGKYLGAAPVSFHALRHTFASRLASAGMHAYFIMYILGYKACYSSLSRHFIPSVEQLDERDASTHPIEEF